VALRRRCRQYLLPELCQAIPPAGLGMNNRLLVGATSGEVVEGARVFHATVASQDRGASGEGDATSSHAPISFPARSTGNGS